MTRRRRSAALDERHARQRLEDGRADLKALRFGAQLELFGLHAIELPWEGQSARGLTRSSKLFSLGAPPARGLRANAFRLQGIRDPAQLDLLRELEMGD